MMSQHKAGKRLLSSSSFSLFIHQFTIDYEWKVKENELDEDNKDIRL